MRTKHKRYAIQVRRYAPGKDALHNDPFELVETIQRVPWAEMIGNFNPLFCRYKGKRTLIQSDEGDLSDPFRRTEDYAKSFYICIP